MSAAVEAAADEPFLTFMRKQVFEPLGMDDTRADSATEPIPNRATSYFPRFAADPRYGLDLMRDVDYSCYAGASAFLSTPSDLVRFGMAINGGKLLQPATVQLLQTSQRLPSGRGDRLRSWLGPRDRRAGGEQTRVGRPRRRVAGRDGGVPHDVSRARDRRGRDLEHLLRGHVCAGVENRAGFRGTKEESGTDALSAGWELMVREWS